jgi:hypothetical protein
VELDFGGLAEGTTAVAPGMSFAGRVFVAAHFGARGLHPALRASFARGLENRVPTGPTRGGLLTWTSGRVEACVASPIADEFRADACAFADLGVLEGEGYGVEPSRTPVRTWFALGSLARVEYVPTPRMALGVEAGFVVPITRDEFALSAPPAPVFRAPPLALTLGGGVAVRL